MPHIAVLRHLPQRDTVGGGVDGDDAFCRVTDCVVVRPADHDDALCRFHGHVHQRTLPCAQGLLRAGLRQ